MFPSIEPNAELIKKNKTFLEKWPWDFLICFFFQVFCYFRCVIQLYYLTLYVSFGYIIQSIILQVDYFCDCPKIWIHKVFNASKRWIDNGWLSITELGIYIISFNPHDTQVRSVLLLPLFIICIIPISQMRSRDSGRLVNLLRSQKQKEFWTLKLSFGPYH